MDGVRGSRMVACRHQIGLHCLDCCDAWPGVALAETGASVRPETPASRGAPPIPLPRSSSVLPVGSP